MAKKSSKTNTILTGDAGRKLVVTLDRKGDDKFITYAALLAPTGETNAKGKAKLARQRGASGEHKTEAEAIKATDALVKAALAGGWSPSKSKVTTKVDAFDAAHLPSPRLVPVIPGTGQPVAKSSKK